MFGRCKHDYHLIDKTVLPSGAEQIMANGAPANVKGGGATLFTKKVIFTFKCSSCNKIKQVTETNP
jgi:hypothetical protein